MPGLRQEVQSLLAADAQAGTFMATASGAALDPQPDLAWPARRLPAAFSVPMKSCHRWAPGAWAKFISPATRGWGEM
jgi:hypothetical protein